MSWFKRLLPLFLLPLSLFADDSGLSLGSNPFQDASFMDLHQQLRIIGLLTAITLIPFVVIMMTSFTRITIIFHFLRQALATQQVPSSQVVIGLSLI